MQDKVVIITGASAGIGRAYALAFAGAGATVIAAARSLGDVSAALPEANTLAEVIQAGRGLPGEVHAQVCDVESEADIIRMVERTITEFGRIDVLVNNAAVYPHHPALAISAEQWDTAMRVNVRGPYLTIKHAAPHMIRQRSGSIINITSGSAEARRKDDLAHKDLAAYGVAKAALNRLTTYMAEELREFGIAVNAMSPGAVVTDTWITSFPGEIASAKADGWGKPATPEVLGPPLLHLALQSPETMTGQILHADGFGSEWR